MAQQPIEASVAWVEGLLLGQTGAAIAVLAIAGVGLSMLAGRLSIRDGARVILGCFILFGAPTIAHGLTAIARDLAGVSGSELAVLPPLPAVPPAPVIPPTPPPNPDPYAGASVPLRY